MWNFCVIFIIFPILSWCPWNHLISTVHILAHKQFCLFEMSFIAFLYLSKSMLCAFVWMPVHCIWIFFAYEFWTASRTEAHIMYSWNFIFIEPCCAYVLLISNTVSCHAQHSWQWKRRKTPNKIQWSSFSFHSFHIHWINTQHTSNVRCFAFIYPNQIIVIFPLFLAFRKNTIKLEYSPFGTGLQGERKWCNETSEQDTFCIWLA